MAVFIRRNATWVDILTGVVTGTPPPVTGTITGTVTANPLSTNGRDALVLGTYRPDSTTTGVRPGRTLTITTTHTPVSGQTYTDLDVRNFVQPVDKSNVTYKDCVFRGPAARPTGGSALYSLVRSHQRGFRFIDCTFIPQTPDYRWNGVQGYGFTLERCDISNLVDDVQVFVNPGIGSDVNGPSDVTIKQCYFHDKAYFPYGVPSTDPRWGGGEAKAPEGSHSDSIQWQGATNLVVLGNYFSAILAPQYRPNYVGGASANAAMQIKPDVGLIAGGDIRLNWLEGGAVTINIADAPAKNRIIDNFGNLSDNQFLGGNQYAPTDIILTSSSSQNPDGIAGNFSGNLHVDGTPARISRGTQT